MPAELQPTPGVLLGAALIFWAIMVWSPVQAQTAPPLAQAQHTDPAWEQALSILGQQARARDIMALRHAVELLGQSRDPRALSLLDALQDGAVLVDENSHVCLGSAGGTRDVVTGEPACSSHAHTLPLTNIIRRAISLAMARQRLHDANPKVRLAAVVELSHSLQPSVGMALEEALATEQDPEVQRRIAMTLALLHVQDAEPQRRLDALEVLENHLELAQRPVIEPLAGPAEGNPEVRAKARAVLERLDRRAFVIHQTERFLQGLSLGSILMLAALGLAITFGLLGIINMAHGEMLMVGAYVCHACTSFASRLLPQGQDAAILLSLPVAFVVTAGLGALIEVTVIRHLYGRPLESLLATWGISLALIQAIRLTFGAQNVVVPAPSWLDGDLQITADLSFTIIRLAVVVLALAVTVLIHGVLRWTSMGLALRAVTQDRAMSSALGLSSARIDRRAFALGSGVAGLAGVALAQLDTVGPNMGQGYIVDAFLVVVVGGVGQLGGTIIAAFGLGVLQKFLEPAMGAVLAKVAILLLVILVIQRRPQGLFTWRIRSG